MQVRLHRATSTASPPTKPPSSRSYAWCVGTSVITARQLRDSSTEHDFDTPSADQLALTGRWRKNGQLFWRELFFAVIAVGDFEHPRICSCSCGGIR